jgi:hypothetical protein
MARRRSRNARRVVVVNAPRRRRRSRYNPHRYRRRSYARANPHRRRYRHNPRRHHYRRNPPRSGGIVLTRPLTWMPVLLTGGLAATVSSLAPHLVLATDASPTQIYMVQASVAAAGAVILPMAGLRGAHVVAWIVGAAAPIVAHFVTDKLAAMLGLAWYPYQALGQHPAYPPRLYGGTAGADMYPYEGGQVMWDYQPQDRSGAPEAPFEHMYNN